MKKQEKIDYTATFDSIGSMFSKRLEDYGDGPKCAEHADINSQEQRMRLLADVGEIQNAKILDFGCATGHLSDFLKREYSFSGEYVGYDISSEMIKCAKEKYPQHRFEVKNVLSQDISENFDFVFISGTFNDNTGNNWDWMKECLKKLFMHTDKALVFNNLSRYVDYFDEHLFYVDPCEVFNFCKEELSPFVTLKHDYSTKEGVMPYEFSTYVYQTEIKPRARK